jgi:hypothetical protein
MMNEAEWEAVRNALAADDRKKLGDPPTAEELLAYERGELSAEEAERVQQLLVAYPELARAYATPFPEEAELPEDVVDRQWKRLWSPVAMPPLSQRRRGRRTPHWIAAIAAAIALVFGAMLWQQHNEALQPRVLPEPHLLTPEGQRGPKQPHYALTPSGDSVLLVVSIIGPADYDTYRLELVRGETRLWSSKPMPATESNSFDLVVPSRLLTPGTYSVIAYGLRGNAQAQVGTYTIDVVPPRR